MTEPARARAVWPPAGTTSGDAPVGLAGLDEGVRITGGRCHSIEHIDTKTKELMALAIGIAIHCGGCITYHTKMAHQHGATKREILEIVALAVLHGRRAGSRLLCRCGACI